MNDTTELVTPKEKLALSRAALLAAMGIAETRTAQGASIVHSLPQPPAGPLASRFQASWLGRWWRRHPARSAVALLEPGLERYAYHKPWQLVSCAAGAGGLLVLLKPWRLLSVGAVVTLIFKFSDVAGALSGLLERHVGDVPLEGETVGMPGPGAQG